MSKWEDIDEVRALFAAIYSPLMAAGMPGTAETAVYKQMLGYFLARIETLFGETGASSQLCARCSIKRGPPARRWRNSRRSGWKQRRTASLVEPLR